MGFYDIMYYKRTFSELASIRLFGRGVYNSWGIKICLTCAKCQKPYVATIYDDRDKESYKAEKFFSLISTDES